MSLASDLDDFFADSKEVIIDKPLNFKAKLGIGQRAYGLLRAREHMATFAEATGVGATAATVANSGAIASTFFASSGFLASIGLGAAAVTPIGWVIAAGVISGGAYIGVSRIFERSKDNALVIIPNYINTPLDVLAATLIELMLPVSLKIAYADSELREPELTAIHNFFVDEWGYSAGFVTRLIAEYKEQLDGVSYSRLANTLGTYCAESKDCDKESILAGFVEHLREIVEADGAIHEQERAQLDYLTSLLIKESEKAGASSIVTDALRSASKGLSDSTTYVSEIASSAGNATVTGLSRGTTFISEAVDTTAKTAKSVWKKLSKLGRGKSSEDASR